VSISRIKIKIAYVKYLNKTAYDVAKLQETMNKHRALVGTRVA
jgi:hypothetical protein